MARLERAIEADEAHAAHEAHEDVYIASQCAQRLRTAFKAQSLTAGKATALEVLESFHTCPIPEVARPGRPLR